MKRQWLNGLLLLLFRDQRSRSSFDLPFSFHFAQGHIIKYYYKLWKPRKISHQCFTQSLLFVKFFCYSFNIPIRIPARRPSIHHHRSSVRSMNGSNEDKMREESCVIQALIFFQASFPVGKTEFFQIESIKRFPFSFFMYVNYAKTIINVVLLKSSWIFTISCFKTFRKVENIIPRVVGKPNPKPSILTSAPPTTTLFAQRSTLHSIFS